LALAEKQEVLALLADETSPAAERRLESYLLTTLNKRIISSFIFYLQSDSSWYCTLEYC